MRATDCRSLIFCLLAGLAVTFLAGCYQDKLTYENFQQLPLHRADAREVTDTIGNPDNILLNRWIYRRPEKSLHVVITFEDDLVSRKEWMDARADRWVDTDEEPGEEAATTSEIHYQHQQTEDGP